MGGGFVVVKSCSTWEGKGNIYFSSNACEMLGIAEANQMQAGSRQDTEKTWIYGTQYLGGGRVHHRINMEC